LSCSASHIAVFLNEICSLSFIKHIPIQLSISPLDIGFLSYAPFFSDPDYPGWDCVAQFGFLLISKRLNRKFILTTLSWETFPIYLPVLLYSLGRWSKFKASLSYTARPCSNNKGWEYSSMLSACLACTWPCFPFPTHAQKIN
jgi:hypothetical protein